MPAVIPAIAGFGASVFFEGATFVFGSAIATSVAIGAVTGAVVGGLQAAVTGGDITDGILYGAVGGAVGGALGGAFNAMDFGSGGGGAWTQAGDNFVEPYSLGGIDKAPAITDFTFTPKAITTGAGEGGFLSGLSDTSKLMLTQGGIGMASEGLKSFGKEDSYSTSQEGVDKTLAQRKYEADLQYKATQDTLANQLKINDANAQIQRDTLAQRKYEADLPYTEAANARDRMRETATGLTLFRKQEEAAKQTTPLTDVEKEYQVVV